MPRFDPPTVWIGFDPREANAFAVAKHSARRHMTQRPPIRGLVLEQLRQAGLYYRPTSRDEGGRLFDEISQHPMATEFAISRFLVPYLSGFQGWALFMDSDVLIRGNLTRLFDLADPTKAVQVVQHQFHPPEPLKMDGQVQTDYPRKNWSSVMLFNCAHPSNRCLTPANVNLWTGRDLHGFHYLDDHEIGALPPEWNYLVGHTKGVSDPQIVHFTDGIPSMLGYEDCEYADEWRTEMVMWAASDPAAAMRGTPEKISAR